jgi:hypothetical protein
VVHATKIKVDFLCERDVREAYENRFWPGVMFSEAAMRPECPASEKIKIAQTKLGLSIDINDQKKALLLGTKETPDENTVLHAWESSHPWRRYVWDGFSDCGRCAFSIE